MSSVFKLPFRFSTMELHEFMDYLSQFCDADKVLNTEIRDTIRVNTLKITLDDFLEVTSLELEPTFYKYGFYIRCVEDIHGYTVGTTWEHYLGYIHSQSLSSMLPSLVLSPSPQDLVLDIAASPGSKTTHMAMLMENRGAILANDISWERNSVLFSNIVRLGVINTKVMVCDACRLPFKERFDKVMADVPCSSLTAPYAYKKFDDRTLKNLPHIQKKMILRAFDALKPGGELVYSTCTYTPEENESVVAFLLEKRKSARLIDLGFEFPHDPGLTDYGEEMKKCARIYPYHFNSEGFFIAKIRKVVE